MDIHIHEAHSVLRRRSEVGSRQPTYRNGDVSSVTNGGHGMDGADQSETRARQHAG